MLQVSEWTPKPKYSRSAEGSEYNRQRIKFPLATKMIKPYEPM
jgi:hypothetical protein